MSEPRTRVPHHHKRSSPKADETHPIYQTPPQCATVTGRYGKGLTQGNSNRVSIPRAKRGMKDNSVLGDHPPPISDEDTLRRPQRTTLSHSCCVPKLSKLFGQSDSNPKMSHICSVALHTPNNLALVNLWGRPAESIRELYIGRLD